MKRPYYRSYPSSETVFTIDDVDLVLLTYLNNNQQAIDIVAEIVECFCVYAELKKGNTYEVVLKGSEILDSILSQNI